MFEFVFIIFKEHDYAYENMLNLYGSSFNRQPNWFPHVCTAYYCTTIWLIYLYEWVYLYDMWACLLLNNIIAHLPILFFYPLFIVHILDSPSLAVCVCVCILYVWNRLWCAWMRFSTYSNIVSYSVLLSLTPSWILN